MGGRDMITAIIMCAVLYGAVLWCILKTGGDSDD